VSARLRRVLLAWLGACACACDAPPEAPPSLPDIGAVDLGGVTGPLEGTIDGHSFHVIDARFRVVTFAGRERVDLLFADQQIERCGLPLARAQTRVWLRVPGTTSLSVGELTRLDQESDALEVHYERPGAARSDGRGFTEAHRAIARLEIESASSELVTGRLHACFADVARSCVAGSFRATPCRGRVDGRALREAPGLDDQALEPLPRTDTESEP
jgi:hypothetical protein